jgi:hypothetical protein
MIISVDAKKTDKFKPSFMTKAPNKKGIEGSYINITKVIFSKARVNIMLNGRKLKIF